MKKKLLSVLLTLTMLLTLLPTTALATTPSGEHTHDSTTYTELTDWTQLATSGSYYLGGNIPEVTGTIQVSTNVTLCLNGKRLDLGGKFIDVDAGANLTICDCGVGGKITSSNTSRYGTIRVYSGSGGTGKLALTSGTVENTGNDGHAIYIEWGIATVTGGTVTGATGIHIDRGTLSVGGNAMITGTSYGINDYYSGDEGSNIYLSGNPTISGTDADIYTCSKNVYAQSKDSTPVAYSGGKLTVKVKSLSEGKVIIHNVTDENETKFELVNTTEYTLARGTDANANNLILVKRTQTPTTYDVTFEENGGSSVTDLTEVTSLPDPLPVITKTGYTFGGWYTNEGLTTEATAGATIAADTTLYAKWIRNSGTPVTAYDLWIGGVQVTSAASSGTGWSYDDSTKTLTLEDFDLAYSGAGWNHAAILCGSDDSHADLTIDLVGDNSVRCTSSSGLGIYVRGTLTFTGNGDLHVAVTNSGSYNPLTATTLNFGKPDDADAFTGSVTAEAPGDSQAGEAISGNAICVYSGTVNAINYEGNYVGIGGALTVSGGTVAAKGGDRAIRGTLTLGTGMTATASTEFDGALGAYEADKHGTYKSIKIEKGDPAPSVTKYTVSVTSGTGNGEYAEGDTVTITANAAPAGQQFKNWTSADGVVFANANAAVTTFTMPAKAVTVTANYEAIPVSDDSPDDSPADSSDDSEPTYSIEDITAKSEHGEIRLKKRYAEAGDKVTLLLKPDAGYVLDTLVVLDARGNEIAVKANGDGTFTFKMPESKVDVRATFKAVQIFDDVAENAYYHDAVLWAVEKGITEGATATSFAPNKVCTRGQIVTFLWRAAGCPAPESTENPFVDLQSDAYYYDAVLWAVENGITQGLTADSFGPQQTVTRGQSMTFLWRLDGAAAADGENTFVDVPAGIYCADAVQWAVEEKITNGMTADSFAPGDGCTRGQIMTFLYRYMA